MGGKSSQRVTLAVALLAFLPLVGCGTAGIEGSGSFAGTADRFHAAPSNPPMRNGIENLDANEILNKAREASLDATSVHVQGSVNTPTTHIDLDLRTKGGAGALGTITENGVVVHVTQIESELFFLADAAFWRRFGNDEEAKLFSGRYVKTTLKNPDFAQFGQFTDPQSLFGLALLVDTDVTKSDVRTINQQQTITLTTGDAVSGSTIHISTTGKPFITNVDGRTGTNDWSFDFSDYDNPVTLTPPPAGQVIDLDKLDDGH